jgi:uncharacterized cupredoxin-like copper-binding protein
MFPPALAAVPVARAMPRSQRAAMKILSHALALLACICVAPHALADARHPHDASARAAAPFGHPGAAKAADRTVAVTLSDDMRFQPDHLTVRTGETVRFVVRNAGKVPHEMVLGTDASLREHAAMMRLSADMAHDDPGGVMVEPGRQRELVWTFDRPGRFAFACLVPGHFEAGMRGSVVVR